MLKNFFFVYSWPQRFLLLEAYYWLFIAEIAVHLLPFRWVAPYLGEHMAELPNEPDIENAQSIRQVKWAISKTKERTPRKSKCLAQSIAGKQMLKKRGVKSTLYLGVKRNVENDLLAHAWLRSGDQILTGKKGMHEFTVVATFAEKEI